MRKEAGQHLVRVHELSCLRVDGVSPGQDGPICSLGRTSQSYSLMS